MACAVRVAILRAGGVDRGQAMSSNSKGSYRTTTDLMMRAFDKLPAEVRQALAAADHNYVAQPLLTRARRGCPPKRLVKIIRQWDEKRADKYYRQLGRQS